MTVRNGKMILRYDEGGELGRMMIYEIWEVRIIDLRSSRGVRTPVPEYSDALDPRTALQSSGLGAESQNLGGSR